MLETKTVKVKPIAEKSTIEKYTMFGWNLHTRQEINGQEVSGSGTDIAGNNYVEYTSYHYVALTFQRERDMLGYARIVELEKMYEQILEDAPADKPATWILTVGIMCLGLIGAIFSGWMLLLFPVGVVLHVRNNKEHSVYCEKWKKQSQEKKKEIFLECGKILLLNKQKSL